MAMAAGMQQQPGVLSVGSQALAPSPAAPGSELAAGGEGAAATGLAARRPPAGAPRWGPGQEQPGWQDAATGMRLNGGAGGALGLEEAFGGVSSAAPPQQPVGTAASSSRK